MANVARARDEERPSESDPVGMLLADHESVRRLFASAGALGDGAEAARRRIAEQICDELELHSEIEERLFYPALQESGDSDLEDVVAEAYEEHRLVRELIQQIRSADAEDPQYAAKLQVLRDLVERHLDEEESGMLPEARAALGDDEDVESLTEEMVAMRTTRGEEIRRRTESLPAEMLDGVRERPGGIDRR